MNNPAPTIPASYQKFNRCLIDQMAMAELTFDYHPTSHLQILWDAIFEEVKSRSLLFTREAFRVFLKEAGEIDKNYQKKIGAEIKARGNDSLIPENTTKRNNIFEKLAKEYSSRWDAAKGHPKTMENFFTVVAHAVAWGEERGEKDPAKKDLQILISNRLARALISGTGSFEQTEQTGPAGQQGGESISDISRDILKRYAIKTLSVRKLLLYLHYKKLQE